MPNTFQKSTLENGVRVLTESYPQSKAVALGIWVLTGTRDEAKGQGGISHFLEHMVFKGTRKRSGLEIAMSIESVGGELNAYTTKEYTCYHTVTLKEHLSLAADVLVDLVCASSFPKSEFDREKKVVLQEIAMSHEEYSESIYDCYLKAAFGGHPTGRPILGDEESLLNITRQDLVKYYHDRHFGKNIIVSAAGALDHQELVGLLEKGIGRLKERGYKPRRTKAKARPIREIFRRPSEQIHLLVGLPTVSYKNPYRHEAYFLNTLLGGGMTSKLYQTIREKKGLAYSVYSYSYAFIDFAMNFYYAGTDQKNFRKALEATLKELRKLKERGVSRKDFKLYKTQMKGELLLAGDDLESRMTSMAHGEMIFKKYRPLNKVVEEIEAITVDSVNACLQKEFDLKKLGIAVMGDIQASEHQEWLNSL